MKALAATVALVSYAAAMSIVACEPKQQKAAADIAAFGCKLVPVVERSSGGALVGALCEDIARLVSEMLEARARDARGLMAPAAAESRRCDELVELRSGGRLLGLVCPGYASLVAEAGEKR